jgi:hypothetical protein
MTFSYCAAIAGTLVQLSASSSCALSAEAPPKDGTTFPPSAWTAAMPFAYVPTGCFWLPFQSTVHEPGLAVCRNASVMYRAPEARDVAASVSAGH